jgi:hypothetical protein
MNLADDDAGGASPGRGKPLPYKALIEARGAPESEAAGYEKN